MWRSWMFWRFFGTSGGLLLVSISLLGAVVVSRAEQHYLQQIEDSLRTRAILVREIVRREPAGQPELLQQHMAALGQEIGTRITLIARDGTVLADSHEDPAHMENHGQRPEVLESQGQTYGTSTRFSDTLGLPMMYVALRVDNDSGPVATVRVALPLDKIQARLAGLRRLVWTAALGTGVAALGLAFWLARRITRPLQELTSGAERIAAGRFGHRVYVEGSDEVAQLGGTFNYMSERLAAQFTQLEEDRQQLRMILTGMVEGVVALDREQRILFANDRAAQLLDFQAQTAVGRKVWEVIRKRSIQKIVQRALA
ncbi:MAG: HAMP domain-containing protein, partial [Planctomycetes bacterium]|nr:HAMP domain-containing protein [Planctomycetota bacterium]